MCECLNIGSLYLFDRNCIFWNLFFIFNKFIIIILVNWCYIMLLCEKYLLYYVVLNLLLVKVFNFKLEFLYWKFVRFFLGLRGGGVECIIL